MRPGGREDWPIKIVETAEKSLERCLVTADPFHGNKCSDKSCLPARNENNKISCRRNNVGYRIPCKLCQKAGESDGAVYIGETGENMHTRMKSHLSNSIPRNLISGRAQLFINTFKINMKSYQKGQHWRITLL